MTSKKKPLNRFLRIILSVMLGLMCALFAIIVSNIVFILLDSMTGIPDTGSTGGIIFDLQRLAVFVVFAALAGVLSVLNLNKSRDDVLISGAVAGGSMAILLFLPLGLLMQSPASFYHMLYLSLPPYLLSPSPTYYTDNFAGNMGLIMSQAWLAAVFILLAAIVVAAISAYCTAYDKKGKLSKNVGKPAIVIGILTLAVMVLPVICTAAGIGAGAIPHPTAINYVAIKTLDESTNANATLNIELMRSPGGRYLDKSMPFTVYIDGVEATNQCLADENRVNVKLDPPTGLSYEEGSKIKIKSLGLSSNIEIRANFEDGVTKTILSY